MSWVKLHRQLQGSRLWKDLDGYSLKVAVHLLLKANSQREPVGGVELNITRIARSCKMTRATVRRCLDELHAIEFLKRSGSVAMVVNFAGFQGGHRVTGHPVTTEPVTPLPVGGHAVTTPTVYKNKKGKKGKKKAALAPVDEPRIDRAVLRVTRDELRFAVRDLIAALVDGRMRKRIAGSVAHRIVDELETLYEGNHEATMHALAVVLGKDDFDWSRPADNALGYIRAIVKRYKPPEVSSNRGGGATASDLLAMAREAALEEN